MSRKNEIELFDGEGMPEIISDRLCKLEGRRTVAGAIVAVIKTIALVLVSLATCLTMVMLIKDGALMAVVPYVALVAVAAIAWSRR